MSRANDISSDNFYTKDRGQRKAWPEGCIWPEPVWDSIWGGNYWEVEDVELVKADEDIEDLLEIREYMDSLVDEGRLNEDYSLNEDYIEYTGIIRTPFRYYPDSVTVLSGFSSGIIRTAF